MIGSNKHIWTPYYSPNFYSFDFSIDQVFSLNKVYALSKGTNNTIMSSGWEYGLNFPNASAHNFMLANAPVNITRNPFTYWMKVQFSGTLKDYHLFGTRTSPDNHWVKYDNSTNRLEYHIDDSGSIETAYCSWTPSIGVNYFITVTYDGTNITFYIDNVVQTTTYTNQTNFNTNMSNAEFSPNLGIGFVNTNGSLSKVEGLVFGVGIFDGLMITEDINLLYNYYARN